jgi:hypothetical protein
MSHLSFLSSEPDFYSDFACETQPFPDAESAWFWCVQTSEAIHSGARLQAGKATTPRPCEAVDIQTVVLRLARDKILSDAHVRALVKYGPRQLRPARNNYGILWQQAMERMTPVLQHKGIVAQ